MEWTSYLDCELLRDDADKTLRALEVAWMMGDAGADRVTRLRSESGDAIWCRITAKGAAQCVCVAPLGEGFDCDMVDRAAFFDKPWPKRWKTKTNTLRTLNGRREHPVRDMPLHAGRLLS